MLCKVASLFVISHYVKFTAYFYVGSILIHAILFAFIFNIGSLSSNKMPICKFLQHFLSTALEQILKNQQFSKEHKYPSFNFYRNPLVLIECMGSD